LALFRLGLLGNLLYFVFLSAAVRLAGIPTTSLIAGLLPITVNWLGRHDSQVPLRRLAAPMLLAVIAAVLAAASALLGRPEARAWTSSLLGVLCALAALASWSMFAVSNSRWLRRAPQISTQDWSLLLGLATGVEALALALPAFRLDTHPHVPRAWLEFAGVSAGVAFGASILGNDLWNRASRLLPVTMSGQLVVFETLFALLYGFIWSHRPPSLLELAAMTLFLLSVALSARAHSTARPSGSTALIEGVDA
jgi:drug/metabolite transporter (DMT)-like permease